MAANSDGGARPRLDPPYEIFSLSLTNTMLGQLRNSYSDFRFQKDIRDQDF